MTAPAAVELDDENSYECESCQGRYLADEGCKHERHLCDECVGQCRYCVDDLREDAAAQAYMDWERER